MLIFLKIRLVTCYIQKKFTCQKVVIKTIIDYDKKHLIKLIMLKNEIS